MGIPQTIDRGLDLFRTLVFDPVVEATIAAYEGPLVGIPIIGSVINKIELGFADALYAQLKTQVVMESALFITVEHRRAFDVASQGLSAIAHDKGIDSPEFLEAHEIEKQKLRKFVNWSAAQPGVLG